MWLKPIARKITTNGPKTKVHFKPLQEMGHYRDLPT